MGKRIRRTAVRTGPESSAVELVRVQSMAPTGATVTADLVGLFYSRYQAASLRNVRGSLADFARFLGAEPAAVPGVLLAHGNGPANALVLRYRADLLERVGSGTVNRRLSAVRSLVDLARTVGAIMWALDVPGVKEEKYRDTRGPGLDGVSKLMAEVDRRQDHKAVAAIRDRALLRLINGMGLRRAEVVSLDLDHVDLDGCALEVLGKGKRERARLSVPPWARAALAAWIEVRGTAPGPLFVSIGKAGRLGDRLTGDGVRFILAGIGASVGVKVRPHGLRHTAITALLDSGADVRDVQKFSRHADLNTLMIYDDNREDKFGKMAAIVDGLVRQREASSCASMP